MLTENNTLNWLQFLCRILPNQEDCVKLHKFIKKEYMHSHNYTSSKIYRKYCK